jgi:transposase, IS30 family
MTYIHLTREERYQIHVLMRQGVSKSCIARELGRNRSTICRELNRNASEAGYKPAAAHKCARLRQTQRRNARQIDQATWDHVEVYLRLGLSPQQVSGRLEKETGTCISHEAMYQHIYLNKRKGGNLYCTLRCQKIQRKRYASGHERRGTLKNRIGIEQRPAVVDERSRIGDWEGDTVIGKGHQGALVTLVERKSRYTLAQVVDSKHSEGVTHAITELLRPHKGKRHTLTLDNGKEFAQHEFIGDCLNIAIYFAHPYCSWERGLNENHNGLLRQFFPKNTNLRKVDQSAVNDAVYNLNHRPRKCLNYMTPHEVFYGLPMRPIRLPTDALRA